jgi:hypothetical protein
MMLRMAVAFWSRHRRRRLLHAIDTMVTAVYSVILTVGAVVAGGG